MMPTVFRIPIINYEIPGYGLMLMIGFLAAILWAARRAARSGADPDLILNCGFIAIIGGVVGSRAMYVMHYWENFRIHGTPLRIALAIVDVTKGGMEHYGGLILATAGCVVYLMYKRASLRWYLDIIAPSAALGSGIARVGCFLNGCCWGATCDLPWAVRFPYGSHTATMQWLQHEPGFTLPEELIFVHPSGRATPLIVTNLKASDAQLAAADETENKARAEVQRLRGEVEATTDAARRTALQAQLQRAETALSVAEGRFADVRGNAAKYAVSPQALRDLAAQHRTRAVHPTQLYATITGVLLALLLDRLYWRRTRDGQIVCALFLLEPAARWLLELVRADNPIDTAGFTISQFLAICMTVAALVGLVMLTAFPPRAPSARIFIDPEAEKSSASPRPAGAPA